MKVLFYIFAGSTLLLIAIHFEKVDRFEPAQWKWTLPTSQAEISVKIDRFRDAPDDIELEFIHVKTATRVSKLDVRLRRSDTGSMDFLPLQRVRVEGAGKFFGDLARAATVKDLPDTSFSVSIDPYTPTHFSFYYDPDQVVDNANYEIATNLQVKFEGKTDTFSQVVRTHHTREWRFGILDIHSDVSIFLIPPFGLIALALGFRKLRKRSQEKS